MAQIAGFRGALWDANRVDIAKLALDPITGVAAALTSGALARDGTRAMYLYHQTFAHDGRAVTRKSVLAAMRLVAWSEGTVRPHEATDPLARDLAVRGIAEERAHTEPVFVGYRDAAREVDRLFRRTEDEAPAVDVTTADSTRHRLWRMASAEVIGKIRPLFAPKRLHLLDGHARYEGMLALHEQLAVSAPPMYSSANYGLACLVNVEDPALVVVPRHRIVRGTSAKRETVLDAVRSQFLVEKITGAAKDLAKQRAALADSVAHQPAFLALFAGDADAWKLTLSPDVSPTAAGVQIHRALQKYDPVVVEHLFVARLLPGASVETTLDPGAVVRALDAGAELGVIARPLTIDQITHVDELGQVLPFGSTGFLPAIANLVVYVVDPEEDLV
jgi:uncharacterized protein (DUF1015 family)